MALGSISPTTDINTNPLAGAQLGLQYGPQTIQALRRSQYLADAIKQMQESGQKITGGWGELGARLLATAILQRSNEKGQDALARAMQGDQDAETEQALSGLRPPPAAAPASLMSPDVLPPKPDPKTPIDIGVPNAPSGAPTADRLALAQAVYGEARGEPAAGQQAVASVILNRAKASGMSPGQVVAKPHQFSGYNRQTQALGPDQLQAVLANIDPVLSGQVADQTGGADHFFNPTLAHPSWGQGEGQMIGQHKFMRLNDQGHTQPPPGVQMTAGPPPQGPMQVAPSMAQAQGAPPPYQVAANGPTPSPPMPSAPDSSPPAAGGPPAAVPPQATAAGGSPPFKQVSTWPMWKPSGQEIAYVESLLRNPRTHQQGVQLAQQMRYKATQPVEATMQMVNNVPTYFGKDPTDGAVMVMQVPKEAMSHVASAQEAGISAPPGTTFNVDPTGNVREIYKPAPGQMAVGAPGQYREAPIPGSTNDPTSPAAKFTNEGKMRDDYAKEIAPYVAAREGYQKVIAAAGDPTQAGAIAMVFGVMKTLDPNSTVREGEQAQVQNSGTIPQTITNIYNKLLTGQGSLTPEQRAQFANTAHHQFDVYQKTFDAANQRYSDLAKSYHMDPQNVVRSFDPIKPYEPPGAGQGEGSPEAKQAYEALFNQGKIDQRQPLGSAQHPFLALTPHVLNALDKPENRGKHIITPDGKLGIIE